MNITKESVFREIKVLALFFGASIIQSYFMCARCDSFISYSRVILFTFCMWIFLFQGNDRLTHFVSRKISWIEYPIKRFLVGLAATIGYTLIAVFFLIFIFQTFVGFNFGSSIRFTVIVSIVVTLVISVFLHAREFLSFWRRALLEAERFQRERISSRYESLKNRVNPQLLYSSLQSLSKLVYTDKENAVSSIKHLSRVYRYILDTRDKEVVTVDEEIKLLESFLFLVNTRFRETVRVSINISPGQFMISPLSIQLIIESIIENSLFTVDDPLSVRVRCDANYIIIDASPQWATVQAMDKVTEILRHIENNYSLLSSAKLKYDLSQHSFLCRIPMVQAETDDRSNDSNSYDR
jgi:sensor histidine kinase YesM